VIGSKRQYQNEIRKKNKNQDETKITLEEEMKSEVLKDQIDGSSKVGGLISKWTQYHHVNFLCLLQCKYNLFQVTSKN